MTPLIIFVVVAVLVKLARRGREVEARKKEIARPVSPSAQ